MTSRTPVRLLALLFALALAAPALKATAAPDNSKLSAQDMAEVDKANSYLQGLEHVKGRFQQISPRGGVSTGDVYVQRPGKARFAYDPQYGLLVVADGKTISIYDSRLKTFNHAPLSSTPLALLLSHEVRLDRDVKIQRVDPYPGGFALTLEDRSRHTDGRIVLYFSDMPMALRGWTVIDAQGQQTQIRLQGLETAELDPGLFVLGDPRHGAPAP